MFQKPFPARTHNEAGDESLGQTERARRALIFAFAIVGASLGTLFLEPPAAADTLTVSATVVAPPTVDRGDPDVPMLRLGLSVSPLGASIEGLTVRLSGVPPDPADVVQAEVWVDNLDNVFSTVDDGLLATASFSGGPPWEADLTFSYGVSSLIAPPSLFVVYDIAAGATPGDWVGAAFPDSSFVRVGAGTTVSPANFPIDSYASGVRTQIAAAPPDTLAVTPTVLAPPAVDQGTMNVPMVQLDLATATGRVLVDGLQVTLSGLPPDPADVVLASLWRDNGDLVFDPAADAWVAWGLFSGLTADLDANPDVAVFAGTPVTLFISYSIAWTATVGDWVGVRLPASTAVRLFGIDTVNPANFPVETYASGVRTEITLVSIDTVTVTGAVLAPPTATQGDVDIPLLRLDLDAAPESATLFGLAFVLTGLPPDDFDVAAVEVWLDDGGGTFDPFVDLNVGTSAFSAGQTYIPLTPAVAVLPGTGPSLFVTVDVAVGATAGNFIGVSVPSAIYVGVTFPDVVSPAGFPIDSYLAGVRTEIVAGTPPPDLGWTGEPGYAADAVEPDVGFLTTAFAFRVLYTSAGNTPPLAAPVLSLEEPPGTPAAGCPCPMVFSGWVGAPGDYVAGAIYSYTTALPLRAMDYRYRVAAQDANGLPAIGPATTWTDGPDVINRAPTLTFEPVPFDNGVDPDLAPPGATFTFRAVYADADNDPPAFVRLQMEKGGVPYGATPYAMAPAAVPVGGWIGAMGDYTAGRVYEVTVAIPDLGADYGFLFETDDGFARISTASIDAPDVTTYPLVEWTAEAGYVTDGVEPDVGDLSTTFVFRVRYRDADGDPPLGGTLLLRVEQPPGTPLALSPFPMVFSGWVGTPGDYAAGAIYEVSTSLPLRATDYQYRVEAYDALGAAAGGLASVWTDGPDVINRPPTLTAATVAPPTGNLSTTFAWSVTYTDLDGDPSGIGEPRVHVLKSGAPIGGSPFSLFETDPLDANVMDGKEYRLVSLLAACGSDYTFYVSGADSFGGIAAATPVQAGPGIACAPVLQSTGEPNYLADGVDPETGDLSTTFTYRVLYADADNDAPQGGAPLVHVLQAGVELVGGPFLMTFDAWLGAPDDYTAGAIYTYAAPLPLRATDYTYYFSVSDATGLPTADWPLPSVDAPDVLNRSPLADAGPDPPDSFRGLLVVLDGTASGDPDGDPLTFSWTQTGGPPVMLTDGNTATPSFVPTELGTYTFELTVDDGFPGGADVDTVLVTVVNRAPTLTFPAAPYDNGVHPDIGVGGTSFTFRIVYADLDNDPPAAGYPRLDIREGGLSIGGSPFAMNALDPADANYADGKEYTYTATLAAVSTAYSFVFEASDGFDTVVTTPRDAPDVVAPKGSIEVAVQSGGKDIEGATVTLRRGGSVVATRTTGAGGRVTFSDLDAAAYTVDVAKVGFQPGSDTVDLAMGETRGVTVTLDATGGGVAGEGAFPWWILPLLAAAIALLLFFLLTRRRKKPEESPPAAALPPPPPDPVPEGPMEEGLPREPQRVGQEEDQL